MDQKGVSLKMATKQTEQKDGRKQDDGGFDRDLASRIDHTLLRADARDAEVRRICAEAVQYGFASVCVNSYWVPLVRRELAGSQVKTCTVIGFPLGAAATSAKTAEVEGAVRAGADELDMVINVGALKSGDADAVKKDIAAVVAASAGRLVKVILETCLLTDEEKRLACRLVVEAGAGYVKTSTGFGSAGATEHDVRLMREAVGPAMGVKASGGIRDVGTARRMLAAGATRIGASASVAIVCEREA